MGGTIQLHGCVDWMLAACWLSGWGAALAWLCGGIAGSLLADRPGKVRLYVHTVGAVVALRGQQPAGSGKLSK